MNTQKTISRSEFNKLYGEIEVKMQGQYSGLCSYFYQTDHQYIYLEIDYKQMSLEKILSLYLKPICKINEIKDIYTHAKMRDFYNMIYHTAG